MKTKTYDHIIKRIKKCTGLSNDDCCVKQLKTRTLPPPHTHIHTHTRTPQKKKKEEHKKTKEKTKQKKHVCLYSYKNDKFFLQATRMYIAKGFKRFPG